MDFCFVHAADLHLDTPFEGISTASPEVGQKLRDASLDAFDALVAFTLKEKASFLLLAGDIYDGSERGVRAQLRFKAGLQKLSETGIRTFIAHGNHDPLAGWSAIKQWPNGVKIFNSREIESVEVKIKQKEEEKGTTVATIYGISYKHREVKENLVKRFLKKEGTGLHIALLHCNVGGNKNHEVYCPCSIEDLLETGMDYWALGHIHKRQELYEAPRIEYPGNLQGRSLKSSEREPKGALLVEANEKSIKNVNFVPLDLIRFVKCEINISKIADIDGLKKALLENAVFLRKNNRDRGLVIRAILKGHGLLHRYLRRPGVIEDILADLRENFETEHPFVWWDSIRDKTRAMLNPHIIRLRKDFSAELINLVEDLQKKVGVKKDNTGFKEFIKIYLEDPIEKAKLGIRVPELTEKDIQDIFEQAEYLALDLLEETNED
jgi:exonuclease SbcD